jgi:hypothetical protein
VKKPVKKKDHKVIVDIEVSFIKCPTKKHRVETAVVHGSGAFDGFMKFGCSCAAEVLLEALKEHEKRKRAKKPSKL